MGVAGGYIPEMMTVWKVLERIKSDSSKHSAADYLPTLTLFLEGKMGRLLLTTAWKPGAMCSEDRVGSAVAKNLN